VKSFRTHVGFLVSAVALLALAGCGHMSDATDPTAATDDAPVRAPVNVWAERGDTGGYVLYWSPSDAPDVTAYQVYLYAPDPSSDNTYVMVSQQGSGQTSYQIPLVSTQTTQIYRVKTENKKGKKSPYSQAVTVTMLPGDSPVATTGDDLPAMRH